MKTIFRGRSWATWVGVLVAAWGCAGVARAQPVAWECAQGGNGHRYEVVVGDVALRWAEARAAAEGRGGYLATITSEAEGAFVNGLVATAANAFVPDNFGNGVGPWLGGVQQLGAPEPDGGWLWITGEAWAYTNWWTGEPNNQGGGERYLHLFGLQQPTGERWNDMPEFTAALPRAYVLEIDEPIRVTPAEANACARGVATFSASAPAGDGAFSFVWEYFVPGADGAEGAWVALVDAGAGPSGASVVGIVAAPDGRSSTLTLTGVRSRDGGAYRCVVGGACGQNRSPTLRLLVCVADVDDGSGTGTCDAGVAIEDLLFFLVAFGDGDGRADADDGSGTGTPDGGVTIEDLLYFLVRFERGC